jgi:hypothetical protein
MDYDPIEPDYPELLGFLQSSGDFKLSMYLNNKRKPAYTASIYKEDLKSFFDQNTGMFLEKISIDDWLFTVLSVHVDFEKKSIKIKAFHPDYVGGDDQ